MESQKWHDNERPTQRTVQKGSDLKSSKSKDILQKETFKMNNLEGTSFHSSEHSQSEKLPTGLWNDT